MATPTTTPRSADEVREIWRESQQTTVAMWQRWAESLQSATPSTFTAFPTWSMPSTDRLPDPKEAVDAVFDLADEVLATQRRFLHEWIGAVQPVVESARRQSDELAKTARRQTGEIAETAEKSARRAQATAKAATTPDYRSMTVEQLQEHAAKADIEGRSGMNKDQLVKALERR